MGICAEKTYVIEIVGDIVSGNTYYNEDQTFQLVWSSAGSMSSCRIASMEDYALIAAKIIFHEAVPSNVDPVIEATAAPVLNYGNVLYLSSFQGNVIQSRLDRTDYMRNSFIKSGLPLIVNKKGDKTEVNKNAASMIKMTLVDWKYEPVILKSPMFIALKIKPAKSHANVF